MNARNPYNYNLPVEPEMFFGRQHIVDALVQALASIPGDSAALIGGRRMGKTSLLEALVRELEARLDDSASGLFLLPVFLDLSGEPIDSAAAFFGIVAERSQAQLDDFVSLPAVGPAAEGQIPAPIFRRALESWGQATLEQRGRRLRLVLLLDECEEIIEQPWAADLHGALRALLVGQSTRRLLKVVMVGSHGFLTQVRQRGSPLWNVLTYHMLGILDREATLDLVVRPTGNRLPSPIVQAVAEQSGGHAFLTQYLMHHLWEHGLEAATTDLVYRVVDDFFHQRNDFWDWTRNLGDLAVNIYRALVRAGGNATEDELRPLVRPDETNLTQAIGALCYHGVIVSESDQAHYRITGQMFRTWFEANLAMSAERRLEGRDDERAGHQSRPRTDVRALLNTLPAMLSTSNPLCELLITKRRRYELLEQQQAYHGTATPPHVLMELEDLSREIVSLVEQIIVSEH